MERHSRVRVWQVSTGQEADADLLRERRRPYGEEQAQGYARIRHVREQVVVAEEPRLPPLVQEVRAQSVQVTALHLRAGEDLVERVTHQVGPVPTGQQPLRGLGQTLHLLRSGARHRIRRVHEALQPLHEDQEAAGARVEHRVVQVQVDRTRAVVPHEGQHVGQCDDLPLRVDALCWLVRRHVANLPLRRCRAGQYAVVAGMCQLRQQRNCLLKCSGCIAFFWRCQPVESAEVLKRNARHSLLNFANR